MKSAIVKTENISFSYNPQKNGLRKILANQISLQVVNDCGWSYGLIERRELITLNLIF